MSSEMSEADLTWHAIRVVMVNFRHNQGGVTHPAEALASLVTMLEKLEGLAALGYLPSELRGPYNNRIIERLRDGK